MRRYLCVLILLIVATRLGARAQADNPELVSANIPFYPPLARQALVYGSVTVAFILPANAGEPTDVEAVSGHPMLKSAAVENVKTWRFRNSYAIARKYQTTFHYTLSESEPRHVTFSSFDVVEVVSSKPPPLDSHF
jgi:TonB family protein